MSVAASASDLASGADLRRRLRAALPALSLALVVAAIAWLNPRAISYFGFTLMLNLAIPIALATVAQMFVIAGNDLDLSIGTFVGFVCCVSATWLRDEPALGVLALLGCVAVYAALGALIYLRNLPSIVVTLGMSFVWQGLAILLLPKPGGTAPAWLQAIMGVKPPFVPFPIVAAVVIAADRIFRADADVLRRDPARLGRQRGRDRARRLVAAESQGGSVRAGRHCSACCQAWRWSASPPRPTPISATATRCCRSPASSSGGGEFVGGRVSPIGAVIGALTLALAASPLLTFMRIPPDWQVAANGAILIIVLAARVLISRKRCRAMTAALSCSPGPGSGRSSAPSLVWLAAIAFTGGYGAGGMLTAALSLAVFTVIVGVGQMFVITLGPGNVDLSLPANIGLASAVAMKTMGGDDSLVAVGLVAALGCGLAVGVANYLLIRALRIPPIIATLSASFIIQSIDICYGRGLQIKPPPGFADFTNIVFGGVPLLAILTALFAFGREYRACIARSTAAPSWRSARTSAQPGSRASGSSRCASRPTRSAAPSAASMARCSPATSAAPTSISATNICWLRSRSS